MCFVIALAIDGLKKMKMLNFWKMPSMLNQQFCNLQRVQHVSVLIVTKPLKLLSKFVWYFLFLTNHCLDWLCQFITLRTRNTQGSL